jgi:predicted Zn-dependent protease
VTRFWYIRSVNPQTVQATGLTRDGLFLIENGEIARPAVNFRFIESPVRLLQNAKILGRGVRAGNMIVPSIQATDFMFSSISDAV